MMSVVTKGRKGGCVNLALTRGLTSFASGPYSEDDDGRAHQQEEGHDGVQEAASAGGHLQGAGERPG